MEAGDLFGVSVDCEEAVHSLYHYLDGELTEIRREEIRVHLDWCGPCGGAAEFEAECAASSPTGAGTACPRA